MTNKTIRDGLLMSSIKDQLELLTQILQNDESKLEKEEEREGGGADGDLEEDEDQRDLEKAIKVQMRGMGALTGGGMMGGDMDYY